MNYKTIAIIAAISGAVLGISLVQIKSIFDDLYGRFPDLDQSIVRKAYMQLMADSLSGRASTENLSDAQMDALFLQYVDRLS